MLRPAGSITSVVTGDVRAVLAALVATTILVAGCAADDPRRAEAAEQLEAPPEWTEQVRRNFRSTPICFGTGCTSFRVEWSAQEPPGRRDLLTAAATADWTSTEIGERCTAPEPGSEPGPYCTLTARSGEIHLTLWASLEPLKDPPWRITLLAE
ncbi:hypothetical protein [Candidatus Poriferisodalis sp.]|uniref:hypothetical protein n=1 Tax=Candidatus Poriferisodalis sp. TaxID=3101277 RepID=UPI003B5AD293